MRERRSDRRGDGGVGGESGRKRGGTPITNISESFLRYERLIKLHFVVDKLKYQSFIFIRFDLFL